MYIYCVIFEEYATCFEQYGRKGNKYEGKKQLIYVANNRDPNVFQN